MIAGEPVNGTPETFAGKIITLIVMLGGLTLFAVFTGIVSAVMVQKLRGGIEVKEMELDELKNHIIICGWDRSASMIIEEFQSDKEYCRRPIVLIAEFEEDPPLNYDVINRAMIYIVKEDYTRIDVLEKVISASNLLTFNRSGVSAALDFAESRLSRVLTHRMKRAEDYYLSDTEKQKLSVPKRYRDQKVINPIFDPYVGICHLPTIHDL